MRLVLEKGVKIAKRWIICPLDPRSITTF